MRIACATNIERRVGVAAIALALLLGGLAAASVGAEIRSPAKAANAFIDWCFANGGNPDSSEDGGGYFTLASCRFSDGSRLTCKFYEDGTASCYTVSPNGDLHPVNPPQDPGTAPPLTRPTGDHGTATGGTLPFDSGDSSTHSQSGGGASARAAVAGGGQGSGAADHHGGHRHGSVHKHHNGHRGKK
jgi:hypothetical protein